MQVAVMRVHDKIIIKESVNVHVSLNIIKFYHGNQ